VHARRSGIEKHVTLHVLRHTFATTLLKNGCPIGHIQGMLGHDRLETTCRYYLGLLNEQDLKKAHERFLEG
jgi:site-specific recombinase XerD